MDLELVDIKKDIMVVVGKRRHAPESCTYACKELTECVDSVPVIQKNKPPATEISATKLMS